MTPLDETLLVRLAQATREFLWVYPYGTRASINRAESHLRLIHAEVERELAVPFNDGNDGGGQENG